MGAAMEDLRWLAAHRDEVPLEPAKSALVEVAAAVLADGGDPLAPALARTALDHDPDPWFEELLREVAGDTAVLPSMDDAVRAAAARVLGDS
jgi:hypothetical protein